MLRPAPASIVRASEMLTPLALAASIILTWLEAQIELRPLGLDGYGLIRILWIWIWIGIWIWIWMDVYGWMDDDGRMDGYGWMDMDGWMDGWMNGWMDA